MYYLGAFSLLNLSVCVCTNEKLSEKLKESTYKAPPPAGPIALKRDIPVIAMPLAAPRCSWS